MKKAYSAMVLLLFCSPVCAQGKPKLAELSVPSGYMISVDGFWEPDNPTKQNEIGPTAIHIECFRHGGREANLVKTEAFCIVGTAMAVSKVLKADFSFQEATWSDDEITMSDDSPICITTKTFFDLKRKTVTGLDIRKPEAKGFMDVCKMIADRQSFYLRDSVDYALFHVPPKK